MFESKTHPYATDRAKSPAASIRLLELAGLRLIGRNYFQFDRKIDLERYRLTLFPGFLTNVNIYEGSLMVNVDLSHKVRSIRFSPSLCDLLCDR